MRRALFLAPLAAAMLLAGCADWHWYRQDGQEAAVSAPGKSLDQRVVGHWRRPGDALCAAGPEIANDHGRLVITTDGQKSVHKLEGVNSRRILTRVIEPAGGPRYRLRVGKGGGEGARPFTLDVENRVTGGTVTWTPCSVA